MKLVRLLGKLLAIFGYILFMVLVIICMFNFSTEHELNGVLKDNWIILVLSILFMIGGKIIEVVANKRIIREVKVISNSEKRKINKHINISEIGIYICMIPSLLYVFVLIALAIYKQSSICMIYCIDTILSRIVICLVLIISLLLIYIQIRNLRHKDTTYWKYRFDLKTMGFILLILGIFVYCVSNAMKYYVLFGIIDGLLLIGLGLIRGNKEK